jgi:hypothetical protein
MDSSQQLDRFVILHNFLFQTEGQLIEWAGCQALLSFTQAAETESEHTVVAGSCGCRWLAYSMVYVSGEWSGCLQQAGACSNSVCPLCF